MPHSSWWVPAEARSGDGVRRTTLYLLLVTRAMLWQSPTFPPPFRLFETSKGKVLLLNLKSSCLTFFFPRPEALLTAFVVLKPLITTLPREVRLSVCITNSLFMLLEWTYASSSFRFHSIIIFFDYISKQVQVLENPQNGYQQIEAKRPSGQVRD